MEGGGCYARKARSKKLVGGGDSNGSGCVGVRETILAQDIYCIKPNPEPNSHYGSWFRKVLGTLDPWIIQEDNVATVIVIWTLTQTRSDDSE